MSKSQRIKTTVFNFQQSDSSLIYNQNIHMASDEKTVKEGEAEVFLPSNVFYNPVQEFNRDITVAVVSQYARDYFENVRNLVKPGNDKETENVGEGHEQVLQEQSSMETDENEIKVVVDRNEQLQPLGIELIAGKQYQDGLSILEGLSASGLRSVRFALEVPGIKEIITNDFDRNAVQFIQKNIEHNKVGHLVKSNCEDASMVMYRHKRPKDRFDVVDIDPYGSPSVFLDAAVQSVKDGGLLIVTCTDLAVLCGNGSETCYSKYGSMSLRAKFCHEMAIRIILQSVEAHANRYSRYIVPQLSISADFYIRIFVKMYSGQCKVKKTASKLAYVYHCTGCGTHTLQPVGLKYKTKGDNYRYTPALGPSVSTKCKHCNHTHHIGGPIWADPIHDIGFVNRVVTAVNAQPDKLNTRQRIIGMLSLIEEELPDQPLYYVTDSLCNVVHCTTPNILQLRSAILNAGFDVSMSHAMQNSLKTNAPADVIWDIIRCWVKQNPINPKRLIEGTPVKAILSQEPVLEADFTIRDDANPRSRQHGLVRYQTNPEKNWGPKMKASKGSIEGQTEKRERLQNKRKKDHSSVDEDQKQSCKKLEKDEDENL